MPLRKRHSRKQIDPELNKTFIPKKEHASTTKRRQMTTRTAREMEKPVTSFAIARKKKRPGK